MNAMQRLFQRRVPAGPAPEEPRRAVACPDGMSDYLLCRDGKSIPCGCGTQAAANNILVSAAFSGARSVTVIPMREGQPMVCPET